MRLDQIRPLRGMAAAGRGPGATSSEWGQVQVSDKAGGGKAGGRCHWQRRRETGGGARAPRSRRAGGPQPGSSGCGGADKPRAPIGVLRAQATGTEEALSPGSCRVLQAKWRGGTRGREAGRGTQAGSAQWARPQPEPRRLGAAPRPSDAPWAYDPARLLVPPPTGPRPPMDTGATSQGHTGPAAWPLPNVSRLRRVNWVELGARKLGVPWRVAAMGWGQLLTWGGRACAPGGHEPAGRRSPVFHRHGGDSSRDRALAGGTP